MKDRKAPHTLDDLCEFRVVGERRDDPGHLLLLGCDGLWYDYDISSNEIRQVELSDSWAVDVVEAEALPVGGASERVSS